MGLFDRSIKDPAMLAAERERVPPGQTVTEKWPVLTYGDPPLVDTATWSLTLSGLVQRPVSLSWADLMSLPVAAVTCDMHCVTRWSKLGNRFEGVRVRHVLERAGPSPGATHVMAHSYGGYTTNLPLADLMDDDALLAFRYEAEPLSAEHGGPCRLLVPKLYLWKSAKWVNGLELMDGDRPGFWERAGYHMYGDPWKEERHGWAW
ncbi:MAG TPA: sulfite oxidase-like oxidoreductase [Candidatus Polarisedimenticolia bacterium]|nr:sulfite oxidase-like oxidoreductase [Candidatus Polarisedimenticolia bacterium]